MERKIEWFILKTSWLYKFGCPFILFLWLLFSLNQDTWFYYDNYKTLSTLFDCSIFFGVRELYACYLYKGKCAWQKMSSVSLIGFGLLDLLFSNYDMQIYSASIRSIALFMVLVFITRLIYLERHEQF
jgi:hypothetical protein